MFSTYIKDLFAKVVSNICIFHKELILLFVFRVVKKLNYILMIHPLMNGTFSLCEIMCELVKEPIFDYGLLDNQLMDPVVTWCGL